MGVVIDLNEERVRRLRRRQLSAADVVFLECVKLALMAGIACWSLAMAPWGRR